MLLIQKCRLLYQRGARLLRGDTNDAQISEIGQITSWFGSRRCKLVGWRRVGCFRGHDGYASPCLLKRRRWQFELELELEFQLQLQQQFEFQLE